MLQNSSQFIHDNIHRMNRGKMKEIGGDKDKLTMFKETHQLLGEALEDIKNKK